MRQDESQTVFRDLLNHIRNGTLNKKRDWPILASRDLKNLPEEERKCFENDAIKICATNKSCKAFNVNKLKEMNVPVAAIKSDNRPDSGKDLTANKAGGMPKDTLLAKGCKVMLHSNLWTEAGLTNGSQGIVKAILFEPGQGPPSNPSAVLVHFPSYKGQFQFSLLSGLS